MHVHLLCTTTVNTYLNIRLCIYIHWYIHPHVHKCTYANIHIPHLSRPMYSIPNLRPAHQDETFHYHQALLLDLSHIFHLLIRRDLKDILQKTPSLHNNPKLIHQDVLELQHSNIGLHGINHPSLRSPSSRSPG